MYVSKGNIYYSVCKKIAEIDSYGEITIEKLCDELHPTFTPRQITIALVKARAKGWIQYTANRTVCLTYPKGRAVFKKRREKEANPYGRVVLKGDAERRIEAKARRIEEKGLRNKLRLRTRPPPNRNKTPSGQRNKHGRLIE